MKFYTICILLISCVVSQSEFPENAALGYWVAAADCPQFPEKWNMNELFAQLDKHKPLTKEQNEWLDGCSSTFKEIVRSSKYKYCRFILKSSLEDGVEMILPHLGKMIYLNRILNLEARRLCLQKEWFAATEHYLAAIRLSCHIQQDNILICTLSSYASLGVTLASIRSTVFNGEYPSDLRQKIYEEINNITTDFSLSMSQAFVSEQYFLLPYQKEFKNNRYERYLKMIDDHLPEEMKKQLKGLPNPLIEKLSISQQKQISQITGIPEQHLQSSKILTNYLVQGIHAYSAHIQVLSKLLRQDYKSGTSEYEKISNMLSEKHFIIAIFSPIGVYNAHIRMMLNLNATQVSLALANYYAKNQHLPQKLSQLELQFVYLSPNSFNYTTKQNGFTLGIKEKITKRHYLYSAQVVRNNLRWLFKKTVGKEITEIQMSD